jgi:molecular chaperone DnaK
VPQIEVTFDIDANGIVHVSAKDKATGKESKITVTSNSGMSKDDIEKAVKEAKSHEAEDKKHREEVEVRNRADSLVYNTEKMLKENKEKLAADTVKDIEGKVAALKEALEKKADTAALQKATEELTQASYKLAEEMYAKAGAAGAPPPGATGTEGAPPNGAADGKKSDVIDAEFTEKK